MGELVEKAREGTLIFFVRKNLRHIFFCDG